MFHSHQYNKDYDQTNTGYTKVMTYTVRDERLIESIERDLQRFVRQWKQQESIGSPEPIDAFCDVLLRGGKRLRGMLAAQSYYAHGGKNEDVALGAARIFEIIQTSLLVVDDIADRSLLRRGGPSAHIRIAGFAKQYNLRGDAQHYGIAQAMNVAYAGLHKATTELLGLAVNDETARLACLRFHENILTTINGQIDDLYNEMTREPISEQTIDSVIKRKTAYYTIYSPLELGASLAGKNQLSPALGDYAVRTGSVFQITDDIISTFGKEDETGKGSNDDIREGKLTLLTHFALQNSDNMASGRLRQILGTADASDELCDEARNIIQASGAVKYAKERSYQHEQEARAALKNKTDADPNFTPYLLELLDFIVTRNT
jgi:geranylgeranyl diphosphate synthase type I